MQRSASRYRRWESDEAPASVLEVDIDRRGTGVQCILDELLHHGGWSFHDLTGRDLVRDVAGQERYARQCPHR